MSFVTVGRIYPNTSGEDPEESWWSSDFHAEIRTTLDSSLETCLAIPSNLRNFHVHDEVKLPVIKQPIKTIKGKRGLVYVWSGNAFEEVQLVSQHWKWVASFVDPNVALGDVQQSLQGLSIAGRVFGASVSDASSEHVVSGQLQSLPMSTRSVVWDVPIFLAGNELPSRARISDRILQPVSVVDYESLYPSIMHSNQPRMPHPQNSCATM